MHSANLPHATTTELVEHILAAIQLLHSREDELTELQVWQVDTARLNIDEVKQTLKNHTENCMDCGVELARTEVVLVRRQDENGTWGPMPMCEPCWQKWIGDPDRVPHMITE